MRMFMLKKKFQHQPSSSLPVWLEMSVLPIVACMAYRGRIIVDCFVVWFQHHLYFANVDGNEFSLLNPVQITTQISIGITAPCSEEIAHEGKGNRDPKRFDVNRMCPTSMTVHHRRCAKHVPWLGVKVGFNLGVSKIVTI
ncbi:Spore germination protein [Sesbania bispinosa]|nr:Spore germination protein [Sesbania bispinosa]